jgi:lipase
VLCVHGLGQHGGVFEPLARELSLAGIGAMAVDLRGHGMSAKSPPWDVRTHATDLAETLEHHGVEPTAVIAHSFGARVSLDFVARNPDSVRRLILLEPGVQADPATALARAEIERLDWTFNGPDAAFRALVGLGAPDHALPAIRSYVENDLVRGGDGQYRFSHSPAAVVVAWSEMCVPLERPETAEMLVVLAADSTTLRDSADVDWFGSVATIVQVPHGHNVLWESPDETAAAVKRFLLAVAPG